MDRTKYTKTNTIMALKLYNDKGELDIPDVQRDLVWTTSQKQLLIDSILKDYDIPKIYFRVRNNASGKRYYEIIDGQQRLNAIFDFMEDKYSLPNDNDPIGDESIAGKKWSEWSSDLQIEFGNRSLDVVYLENYTDEETDETFLRLQNGTPLKAPEKRRAIAGNMRNIIADLAKHKIFENYCDFSNSHYAYEDVTAKVFKQFSEGLSSISATALARMYEQHASIDESDKTYKEIKKVYSFLEKAFKNNNNPHLKKYAIADLAVIAKEFLSVYDLNNYANEFGKAYLDFCDERILNNEKPEDQQDQKFLSYGNAARGDSLEFLEYRQKVLKEYILEKMPYLSVKDQNRNFTPEQRAVIYRLGNGVCALCGSPVSEQDFEADHKIPWSKGGVTQISNAQVLCSACNKKKSDHLDSDSE